MKKEAKKDILISQMRRRIEISNSMNIEQVEILHGVSNERKIFPKC